MEAFVGIVLVRVVGGWLSERMLLYSVNVGLVDGVALMFINEYI